MRADGKFWDLIIAVLFSQSCSEFCVCVCVFLKKQKKNPNHRAVGLHASLELIFIYVWNQRGIKPKFVLRKMDGEPRLANWSQTESSVGLIRQGRGAERQQMSSRSKRTDGWSPPPGTARPSPWPLSYRAMRLPAFWAPTLCQGWWQAFSTQCFVSHLRP